MDSSTLPRARTASAFAAGAVLDFSDAFPPSKRARIAPIGGESAPRDAVACDASEPTTLTERLLLELSASAAWKLSHERSVAQNEAFLNEQLEHAVLLGGGGEMTAETCRLPFAKLLEDVRDGVPRVESHVRHAMDIVSWLLVLRQQDARRYGDLMDRQRMLEKDVERKANQIQQLQGDVEALKTQLALQENMFHGREQALVAERRTLLQDKKQLEVMCAKLQGQETGFKTQLRRKDVEYERLKKSLQDAAQRSAKEQRGMSMGKVLNGLSERRQTAQRIVQSHETLMSRRLVENLERKRDELLFENEALAKNYDSLQKMVESVSAQYKKAVSLFLAQKGDDFNTDETMELARVPIDDFTPAPLQLGVKTNVSAFIAETVHKLADKIRLFERAMQAELEYSMRNPSEELVNRLKQKLAEAEAVIREQDRLLQASLIVQPAPNDTPKKAKISSFNQSQSHDKENYHINTGKPSRYLNASPVRAGRRRPVEQVMLEQWEDDLQAEFNALRRRQKHVDEERELLQSQGEKLDMDRLAFQVRNFDHFFGPTASYDDEIDLRDIDCPSSPRTASYLRSIGIFASVAE